MDIGLQIKKFREQQKISQEELAFKIFVSRQTISNWETNKSCPDVKSLITLSNIFNVSLDNFIKEDIKEMREVVEKATIKKFNVISVVFLIELVVVAVSAYPLFSIKGNIGIIIWLCLFAITLYTASKTAAEKLQRVKIMPPVCAGRDVHRVFQSSKINLNITMRGIEGGTPQRIMDIMGAGGFVLTSYSPETAELFEEDKEIVMFKTPEELLEKVDFYLEHEDERELIAQAGHDKVMKSYTYQQKMEKLLEWVEKES